MNLTGFQADRGSNTFQLGTGGCLVGVLSFDELENVACNGEQRVVADAFASVGKALKFFTDSRGDVSRIRPRGCYVVRRCFP
ncbi:hypothetical protein BST30_01960 [Mycobacterium mantenii]|uniref:Uncharacterized protein n=1 Tax=Mycobacterium mantenii TaxID=560555 RepID=A0A1X0G4Q9_MYCNT|nr:hypothetical protein BST30_01960 [Mycobacterium mantenii]